jgi:tRNA (guanosine-2'-O-)-methyltransferase
MANLSISDEAQAKFLAELQRHPLGQLCTKRRLERMISVLSSRLTTVTVVMENLYDSHNVSAVVRSAEGFGLDRLHVVEQPNKYQRNPSILQGADRWVDIVRHPGLNRCLLDLQAQKFTICVADVGEGCVPLTEIPVDRPVAIVMGAEKDGLSERAKYMADVRYTIPMAGFTESFNVSVSAAISLFSATERRRRAIGVTGELTLAEMRERADLWLKKTVKHRGMPPVLGEQETSESGEKPI